MKILARTVSFAIIASALLFFSNCGSDSAATPPEKIQLDKLSRQWSLSSVTLSTVAGTPTQIDNSFKITFSGAFNSANPEGPYNFSVTGTEFPSPWPPSGTWEFANVGSGDSGTLIRLNDNMPISYTISSTNQLTLTFTCPAGGCQFDGARANQVVGIWTFELN